MIVVIQAFPMSSELLQAILVDVAEPVAKTNQPEPSQIPIFPLAVESLRLDYPLRLQSFLFYSGKVH